MQTAAFSLNLEAVQLDTEHAVQRDVGTDRGPSLNVYHSRSFLQFFLEGRRVIALLCPC